MTVGSYLMSAQAAGPEYLEVLAIKTTTDTAANTQVTVLRMASPRCLTSVADTPIDTTTYTLMVRPDVTTMERGAGSKTTLFMDPWGPGSNVTEPCYVVTTGTVNVNPGLTRVSDIATTAVVACDRNAACTSGASAEIIVENLDLLGASLGDFILVTRANDNSQEYMRIIQIHATVANLVYPKGKLTVLRGQTPNCLAPLRGLLGTLANNDPVALVTKDYAGPVQFQDAISPLVDDMNAQDLASVSTRAIVELSPREPIAWVAAAPPPPPPHFVDLRVTMPYSLAEFNVPSVTEPFKRAIARVAGTTADKIVLSFPEQRRAATDTLLVDVRILADSAAEVKAILSTLGADPDTLECASTCRAALLVRLNKELKAEGLREALAIEIRGSSVVATKKKKEENMLLLLLLLLLIPIGAAVYWCCKQEP